METEQRWSESILMSACVLHAKSASRELKERAAIAAAWAVDEFVLHAGDSATVASVLQQAGAPDLGNVSEVNKFEFEAIF